MGSCKEVIGKVQVITKQQFNFTICKRKEQKDANHEICRLPSPWLDAALGIRQLIEKGLIYLKRTVTRSIIDDGFNPELVETAFFDGFLEIPIIDAPSEIRIPEAVIPYSQLGKSKDKSEFVHFYEHDFKFKNFLIEPQKETDGLRQFAGVITPDCSLYRDMPLVLQYVNVYFNRAIGYYLSKNGLYVVHNVRWGDERSYGPSFNGEKVAFLGLPKESIVSVGTYGCIMSKEDRYYFKAGLDAMLQELSPKVVLVYGAMPGSIFGDYLNHVEFHRYPDWISSRRRGAHGNR